MVLGRACISVEEADLDVSPSKTMVLSRTAPESARSLLKVPIPRFHHRTMEVVSLRLPNVFIFFL